MPSLQRYGGEALPDSPHIVVLGSCKVGNFVVSTPVLEGLKARFPGAVTGFVGSEITVDFEAAHPAIDWRLSWDDLSPGGPVRPFFGGFPHPNPVATAPGAGLAGGG